MGEKKEEIQRGPVDESLLQEGVNKIFYTQRGEEEDDNHTPRLQGKRGS